MPINKSFGREMDKRTRELEKRGPGSGSQALQEQQLAQNQLQAIQNEQRSNLMSQRTEAAAMAQQNQLLSQAAELGVDSSTAATLGKYGMKSPPRVQRQQGRQVNVTPNKITIVNNTNTTTTNNVQQGGGGGGNNDSAAKFKTWLGKVNMQQAEQASKRDRDYARRESSLTRSANKMLRRIEKVGSSVAEAFSPQSFGQTLGSQLKMYLLIFGMKFLAKYWDKVLYIIDWIGKKFEDFTAWLGIGEKGKIESSQGRGLIPTMIRLLGGDPGKESVADAFKNSLKAAFDHFSLKLDHMMEERAEAMKKVKLNINTEGSGALSGILKGLGLENLFQGVTTYLGDILTALINPKAGAAKQVSRNIQKKGMEGSARHMNTGQYDNAAFGIDRGDLSTIDRNNKARYGLIEGAVGPGNVLTSKAGGQISQSLDIIGALKDAQETGYVDPARFLAGLERMQDKARTSGYIAVDYEFLTTFLSTQDIRNLTNAKHIRLRKYKVVKVKKADAHGFGDYVVGGLTGGLVGKGANIGVKMGAKGVAAAASHTTRVGLAAGTTQVAKTGLMGVSKVLGPAGWVVGGVATTFLEDMSSNDYTLEFAPLDDPREAYKGMVEVLYEIDEYVLKQIAKQFGVDRFDTSNERLMTMAQRFIYQRAGGYAATQKRWKGKGSNNSISISEEYRPVHEMDNLRAAHEQEEKTDAFSQRWQTTTSTFGGIVDEAIGTAKGAYQGVKGFFTEPTGDKPEVLYSPSGYTAKTGYGPRQASSIETYVAPPQPRYGGINKYTGKGGLKKPKSTKYTFSADAAVKEALRLSKLVISGKSPSKWVSKSSNVKSGSSYLATYARLVIAKGLGKNDLPERPAFPYEFADILPKYGFCPLNWEGYSPRKGDICVFGPTSGQFRGGYVSIFSGNKWISDHEQLDIWPDDEFRSNGCATIFRHLKVISDKSQGEVQYEISSGFEMAGATGYIDFDGDGKFDAIQTQSGTFKLNEDGTFGDLIKSEELAGLLNSSSTFMEYNAGSAVGGGYGGDTGFSSFTITGLSGYSSEWQKAVVIVKSWFERNVHEYKQCTTYTGCTILGGAGAYRKDCSGFVSACLVFYGVPLYDPNSAKSHPPASAEYTAEGGAVEKLMLANGFQKIPFPGFNNVQPFDIMTRNGHIEIYAGNGLSYSWGRVHDLNTPIGRNSSQKGMPSYTAKDNYKYIYRCVGKTANTGNNSLIKNMGDSLTIEGHEASATNPLVDFSTSGGAVSYGGGGYSSGGGGYSGGVISSGGSGYGWVPSSTAISGTGANINLNDPVVLAALNHVGGYAKGQENDFIRDEYLAFRAAGMSHVAALASVAQDIQESGYGTSAAARQGNNYAGISAMKSRGINPYKAGSRWGGFQNLGHYAVEKKALLDRMYKGAATASTPEEYARILQGLDANGNVNRNYAWCATETSGGVHSDRFDYVNHILNNVSKVDTVVSQNVGSIPDVDPTTQAIKEGWDKAEGAVSGAATQAYDIVTSAIKGLIPEKSEFLTFEKDFDKKIEAMSDDQLAAKIWLNNSSIRKQYEYLGFEGWRKSVFNKMSKGSKKRYYIEEEGKDIIARTSTYSDGKGYNWSGINNLLGGILSDDMYNSATGELTEKGLAYVGTVYAKMSPEERKKFAAGLKLESNWRDIKNDVNQKFETGDYGDEELSAIASAFFNSPEDPEFWRNYVTKSQFFKNFYKAVQLGDLESAKKNFGFRAWSPLDYFTTSQLKGKGYDKTATIPSLVKLFAPEQYNKILEGQKAIVDTDLFKRFNAISDTNGNAIDWENPDWKKIATEHLGKDYYYTESGYGAGSTGGAGSSTDYAKYGKIGEDYYKYLAGMYQVMKGKYVQEHLLDGYENITEKDSAASAYEKQRRNAKRAELNRQKYDLQYQKDNWDQEYISKFYTDPEFQQEMLWNHGVGIEANKSFHESQMGQDMEKSLTESIDKLNEEIKKLNGENVLDSSSIIEKFKNTKESSAEGAVVSPEEIERINTYMTTGAEAFDKVYKQRMAELEQIGKEDNETDEEKNKRDNDLATIEAGRAQREHGQEVWERLVKEIIDGKVSLSDARAILKHQGIDKVVTDEQLKNIQKNKQYSGAPQQTVREIDENGNVTTKYYGADGKEIQVEDYEYDKSGNKVIDKKTGKPKMIKRGMKTTDTKAAMAYMENSDIIQNEWGTGDKAVVLKVGGRELTLGQGADGKWYYYDPKTNEVLYDYNLNPIPQEPVITPGLEEGAPALAAAIKTTGASGPSIVGNVSQTTEFIQTHENEVLKKGGYSKHGVKFTSENSTVDTKEIDFSKYKNIKDNDEALMKIIADLGWNFSEVTAEMKDFIKTKREESPDAKLNFSTFSGPENAKLTKVRLPDGSWQLMANKDTEKMGLANIDKQAQEFGFSTAAAKLYAESIQKEKFAAMEIQRKLQEGTLTAEGLVGGLLQQILQAVTELPSQIKLTPEDPNNPNDPNDPNNPKDPNSSKP